MTKPEKNIHAVALGRLGGATKSPKRAAASRRNGRLGGRPRQDGEPPQPRAAKVSPIVRPPKPIPQPKRRGRGRAPSWEF
jgi:hypothetical protein